MPTVELTLPPIHRRTCLRLRALRLNTRFPTFSRTRRKGGNSCLGKLSTVSVPTVVAPRGANSRQKRNSVKPCGFGNQHEKASLTVAWSSLQSSRFGRHRSLSAFPEPPQWKASTPGRSCSGKIPQGFTFPKCNNRHLFFNLRNKSKHVEVDD